MNRGQVVYRTLAHVARCENCPWRGKPLDERTPPRFVRVRNSNASNHARRHGHRVVVEIRRVFDRRSVEA